RVFRRHPHDRMPRPVAVPGWSHAVGAGQVVDEQRAGSLFRDQRVHAREVAALSGERAAIAVATDQQTALQLLAVDLELTDLAGVVASTAAVGLASAIALGRAQAQEPARLGAHVDID